MRQPVPERAWRVSVQLAAPVVVLAASEQSLLVPLGPLPLDSPLWDLDRGVVKALAEAEIIQLAKRI